MYIISLERVETFEQRFDEIRSRALDLISLIPHFLKIRARFIAVALGFFAYLSAKNVVLRSKLLRYAR